MNKNKNTFLAAFLLSSVFFSTAQASPWASPGDSILRSDVEVLARYGLITGPVNNWPMSWKQITGDFYKADSMELPTYVSRALDRVRNKIPNEINVKAKAYYTNKVQFFRGFEDEARSKAQIESAVEVNLDSTSVHIEGRYNDNEDFNLDGSYISQEIGNWSAYAGAVDRWWGPGQETTTLLSTNARPMPSIGIRRIASKPFKTKWLNWMGPWDAEVFVSKMDKDRHIPEPIFVGMRLNFEPINNFEIGMARTLMLCGQDRPCGTKQWLNGLIAFGDLDNRGSAAEQPGNQLAMLNLSYSFALNEKLNIKLYAEGTAEDIVVVVPYTYSRLIGASIYGPYTEDGNQIRLTAEYSDTTGSLAWLYGEHRKGIMYNHFIYNTGYRYYGRVMGHSLDTNSKFLSLNATILKSNGWEYGVKYQYMLINSESNSLTDFNTSNEQINSLSMKLTTKTNLGDFQVNGMLSDNSVNTPLENKVIFNMGVNWKIGF